MRKKPGRKTKGFINNALDFDIADTLIKKGFSLRQIRLFKNKRGQAGFINLMAFIMVAVIFVFAAPVLFEMVGVGTGQTKGLTSLIITLFPWVVGILIVFIGIRSVIGSDN